MKDPKLTIVMKKLEDVHPYAQNAKLHDDVQVAKIMESIVQYGFCEPISVDKDGVIIKGHGRLLAMQNLKRKEIPCYVRDDLTPQEVQGLRIADNRVAESGMDHDMLKMEFQQINVQEIFTGYTPVEIQLIVDPPNLKPEESSGTGEPVISFTIVFDDQKQQDDWFGFIRHLKANEAEGTLAAKIMTFLQDHADF
jgi:hypothetical protein